MSKSKEKILGAVYCGSEIAPGVFAEEVGAGRFLIRAAASAHHARRVGEVFGRSHHYQALTMGGAQVATKCSLKAAALALVAHATGSSPTRKVPFITAMGNA